MVVVIWRKRWVPSSRERRRRKGLVAPAWEPSRPAESLGSSAPVGQGPPFGPSVTSKESVMVTISEGVGLAGSAAVHGRQLGPDLIGAAGGRVDQGGPVASGEAELDPGERRLGVVVEGDGELPGHRVGRDLARELDQDPVLGGVDHQVEGEQGVEGVGALLGQVDGARERVVEQGGLRRRRCRASRLPGRRPGSSFGDARRGHAELLEAAGLLGRRRRGVHRHAERAG